MQYKSVLFWFKSCAKRLKTTRKWTFLGKTGSRYTRIPKSPSNKWTWQVKIPCIETHGSSSWWYWRPNWTLSPLRERLHHRIKLTDSQIIAWSPYSAAPVQGQEAENQIAEVLKLGMLKESDSAWFFSIMMSKKQDNNCHASINCRLISNRIFKTTVPLPHIDDTLAEVTEKSFYSKIDLAQGYHQLRMHPGDEDTIAFSTTPGQYPWRVMPFGLKECTCFIFTIHKANACPLFTVSGLLFRVYCHLWFFESSFTPTDE